MVGKGVDAAIGADFLQWGKQSGHMAAKVLAGVPPDDLAFEKTSMQNVRVVDE